MKSIRIGIDIGSTTGKLVALDNNLKVIYSEYTRHYADINQTIIKLLENLEKNFSGSKCSIAVTGSIGMGVANNLSLPFVQEVSAVTEYSRQCHPDIRTIIDIGGEDAKIVYLKENGTADLRMNGNCAGGTGTFIDQMALLMGIDMEEMNRLALESKILYPIASRCGVFSKTDVQNLISKKAEKSDIAASIFHAIVVQTIVTLSRGCDVELPVLFCGGPLTFIPALQKAFVNYLSLNETQFIVPDKANILAAWGTALMADNNLYDIKDIISQLKTYKAVNTSVGLPVLFENEKHYAKWKVEKSQYNIKSTLLNKNEEEIWLGIDSGSTTTKIVAINSENKLVFEYYAPNKGESIESVKNGLNQLLNLSLEKGIEFKIIGSASTGYGEDMIKAAFGLSGGTIETIAHFLAARQITPHVSFILDIGGQDMKAIFVENGMVKRLEINEACSSGCGSFIETFAKSMNIDVNDFSQMACVATSPCDLGTRCTVFMNSKVKQVLRDGASVADIAAGLSYSVVKNCLYKVLKLKDNNELGENIVVQGGTMKNDAIVRILEMVTEKKVFRSNIPELMGAYGTALFAKSLPTTELKTLKELIDNCNYNTKTAFCKGCVNHCTINVHRFSTGNIFYSGNKCEKIYTNGGQQIERGENASVLKYNLTFKRQEEPDYISVPITIGIPRILNMYENYPFWEKLFEKAGIKTVLSDTSVWSLYEKGVHTVMSDNICLPAKVAHGHIFNLIEKKVDRIFMPYVVLEKSEGKNTDNSYNCPIVSGYSDVIKSAISMDIPVDAPILSFKSDYSIKKSCQRYLSSLGIPEKLIGKAIKEAIIAQKKFEQESYQLNQQILENAQQKGKLIIMLAGRPYHADPLIQHKISEMICDLGAHVITQDMVYKEIIDLPETHMVTQWSYTNRILKAAKWVAEQSDNIQYVQLTSFGCGPDAFLLDEVDEILKRKDKSLTILKVDDVNNIGSLKLRVRSLIESLKFAKERNKSNKAFISTPSFEKKDKKRTILAPFFTEYISPLMPAIFKLAGYHVEVLPQSDRVSSDYGLKYANNEVCYPATLIIGDIIKALKTGKYDTSNVAVAISQTGGQCRASNYLSLIKKGLVDAGFSDIPVIAFSLNSGLKNNQKGFKINWLPVIHIVFDAILYSDCVSKFYHAAVVREKESGQALKLRDFYIEAAKKPILENNPKALKALLEKAVTDFNNIIIEKELTKVGIVGEIFLKFNDFANRKVVNWFIEKGIEVVPPTLTGFFMQGFVNRNIQHEAYVKRDSIPNFVMNKLYHIAHNEIERINKIASEFKYFTPFNSIFYEAIKGRRIVSLAAQFGEGWLLPAEIVSFVEGGVNNVISLQPFGCIANHVVAKGIEKKIKTLYSQTNLLYLDFDSGVSDANIHNRLHLMADNLI